MRVLAVGAHPDDLEMLAGGTLARYVADGHDVTMCHIANGDLGSVDHPRDQLAAVRADEAKAAAVLAGARYDSVGVSDAEIDATSTEQRRLMVDVIREARPDVVLTHAPNDYHSDHNEASKLVFDTTFLATVPLVRSDHPHVSAVPALIYMDTVAGLDFEPTEFVDITDWMDTKAAMLGEHRSQIEWLGDHSGVDLVEDARTVARFRGMQCGVTYAEAFRPCTVFLRATTRRLLP